MANLYDELRELMEWCESQPEFHEIFKDFMTQSFEEDFEISKIPEEVESLIKNHKVNEVAYTDGILELKIDLRKPATKETFFSALPEKLRKACVHIDGVYNFRDHLNITLFRVKEDLGFWLFDNNDHPIFKNADKETIINFLESSLFTRHDHHQLCGMLRAALPVDVAAYDYGSNQFTRFEYCDEGNTYSITIRNNKFYLFDGCNEEEYDNIFGLLDSLRYFNPRYL